MTKGLSLYLSLTMVIIILAVILVFYPNDSRQSLQVSYYEVPDIEVSIVKDEPVRISDKGKKFIKSFESLSLISYRVKGETSNTIGWGHKINSSDPSWLQRKYLGHTITREESERIFQRDINTLINPALNRIITSLRRKGVAVETMNQDFIDGLASLIYNYGESGLMNTKFYKYLSRGDFERAINSMDSTRITYKGHITRRSMEKELMKSILNYD